MRCSRTLAGCLLQLSAAGKLVANVNEKMQATRRAMRRDEAKRWIMECSLLREWVAQCDDSKTASSGLFLGSYVLTFVTRTVVDGKLLLQFAVIDEEYSIRPECMSI